MQTDHDTEKDPAGTAGKTETDSDHDPREQRFRNNDQQNIQRGRTCIAGIVTRRALIGQLLRKYREIWSRENDPPGE